MKTPTLIAACILALSTSAPAADEEALSEIRQIYGKISEAKPVSTKTIEFNIDGDPFEGSITYKTYAGGLTYIFLSYVSGDHGGDDEHYYFGPDGLFFVFQQSSSWRFGQQDSQGNSTTIDSLRERRFYFNDGRCIQELDRQGESADSKKLNAIVSKLPNKSIEPGKEARALFRRSLALKGLSSAGEATRYFESEGETP